MSKSDADTTAMLVEVRKQALLWEQAMPGSRQESEAAEAATRVMAELDAALCMGAHLPIPWQVAQYPQPDEGEASDDQNLREHNDGQDKEHLS